MKKIIAAAIILSALSCNDKHDHDHDHNHAKKNESKEKSTNWELAFKIKEMPQPESVVLDEKRNVLFISNQNNEKEGFISMLSTNGAIIKKEWVKGLNVPKGIKIIDNKLYVSDETFLVEIDIEKAEITNRYKGNNAKFLNDVESDKDGNIYVSDMLTSSIYKLNKQGQFEVWVNSPELEFPNGLLIRDNDLYVAAWGEITNGKVLEAKNGNLLKINLTDKKITKISNEGLGNLDGLQNYQDNFLISDWTSGAIFEMNKNKKPNKIIDTSKGIGDIAYIKDEDLLYAPMSLDDEILVFKKEHVKKPIGIKRDGSYYTRIEWTNSTLSTPLYWVNNIIDDDTSRDGGSWGAPTDGPAEVILSFFGETQTINKIRIFHNVGATISPLDELASQIKIYTSDDANLLRVGDEKADVSKFDWKDIIVSNMDQKEGWVDFELKEPIKARFVRLELVKNFGTPTDRAFTETNEIKIY